MSAWSVSLIFPAGILSENDNSVTSPVIRPPFRLARHHRLINMRNARSESICIFGSSRMSS